MPRNGTGTYSLPQPPFVAGTTISSAAVNSDLSDIAAALTGSLPRDGQAGMSGQFKSVDGSAAIPGISFVADPNSGFFRAGSDQLGVAVGGVQVATFTSSGLIGATPIGLVADFAGSTAPSLWYLCYGQAVSRTTYSALFAIIGTTYGSGDGSTTFNLPDLRGRAIVGKDDMGGSASGRVTSTFFGSDPTILGDSGGTQSKQILTTNLPSFTPSGTITVFDGPISVSGSFGIIAGAFNNNGGGGGSFAAMSSTPSSPTASQSGTTAAFAGNALGGSSTAFSIVQPSFILNKIIYAGA